MAEGGSGKKAGRKKKGKAERKEMDILDLIPDFGNLSVGGAHGYAAAAADDDYHHKEEVLGPAEDDAAGPAEDDATGPAEDDVTGPAEDDATDERSDRLALQAQDLISRRPFAMRLVQDGRVFAFKEKKDETYTRYAEISLDGVRLLIHSLRRRTVPANAAIVEMDELLPLPHPSMAFLELEGPLPKHSGRVFIAVIPETSMAIHFTLMCTGQLGPTYAGSHLVGVFKKNIPGQRVYAGDYDNDDGSGGATLFDLDTRGTTRNLHSVGQVCARKIRKKWSAQFGIITRNFTDATAGNGAVFGNVTDGMDLMTEAVKLKKCISDIQVVDCGVVLPPP